MSKVNPDNFVTIQGWMVSDLKLKGNELLVYAIIYGFTQDGESKFNGSRQYLADWCNCSVRSIQTVLNNLVENRYIAKYEEIHNNVKYCSYATIFTGSEKFSRGSENFSLNNIVDNNSNTLSKDNVKLAQQEFNFGVSEDKSKKKTNNEEYLDACLLINNFTDDNELKKLLGELLDSRIDIASIQRHHFYASTFKHYLDDLSKVNDKIGSVKLSLRYNSTLKVMEPNKSYVTPDTNTEVQNKYISEEERINKMARNKDGTPMVF